MEKRIIVITGNGTATKMPDYIEINMELVSSDYDYSKTMSTSDEKYNNLLYSLRNIGVPKEDLKTISFNINAEYKMVPDDKGMFTNEFVGYRATQGLLLGFSYDLDRLNDVVNAINRSGSVPNININFTVMNQALLTDMAINNAVQDARRKAEVLVAATAVKLLDILEIDYTNRLAVPITNRFSVEYSKLQDVSFPTNINPSDVSITTSVTITWEIV